MDVWTDSKPASLSSGAEGQGSIEGVGSMRRKSAFVPNRRSKAVVYACSLIALGAYAVPRLPRLQPGLPGTFAMLWILFAVLALAANLYFMLGADEERKHMLEEKDLLPSRNTLRVSGSRYRRQRGL